jgi:hypothetical protein
VKGNMLILRDIKKNSDWCDKDHVMLCACFQVLADFLGKERPEKIIDVKHHAAQKRAYHEWLKLYRYWKKDRPKLVKLIDRSLAKWHRGHKAAFVKGDNGASRYVTLKSDRRAISAHQRLEERLLKTDDKMLHRLISARHQLWC